MRRVLAGILILAAAVANPAAQAADITVKPLSDAAYPAVLKQHSGKVVLVNFWATWCGPCKKEMPELIAMAKRLGPKFELILISADEANKTAQITAFLTKLGYQGTVYQRSLEDADAFIQSIDAQWGGGLPASVLYNKTGKKHKIYTGELPFKTAEPEIRKLL
jgi:thiol-disulfide isomerase/thioredoxin